MKKEDIIAIIAFVTMIVGAALLYSLIRETGIN
jgi:hypothetical protein